MEVVRDWLQRIIFKDEMKQIEFMQSRVPVYLKANTEQSMIFLKKVNSFIPDVFDTTDIRYLIDYKWRKTYRMYLPLIVYFLYVYVMIDTALNYSQTNTNKEYIYVFNILNLLSEFYQLIT